MKIKYLLLDKKINLPGIGLGNGNKLSANGLDTVQYGCVKAIVRRGLSFFVFIPAGLLRGWYEIPPHRVEHVGVELTDAEHAKALGEITEHDAAMLAEKLAKLKAAQDAKDAADKAASEAATAAAPKTQRKPKPAQA